MERLLADRGIVRNRAKVEATIANARATLELPDGLSRAAVVVRAADPADRPRPASFADVPATTPESTAMAKDLRRRGFRFVGPTTAYALMQACGLVDDHLTGCWRAGAGVPSGEAGQRPVKVGRSLRDEGGGRLAVVGGGAERVLQLALPLQRRRERVAWRRRRAAP